MVAFLSAILVVAEVCAAEGVFAAVGSVGGPGQRREPAADAGCSRSWRPPLTTAALSLDATVVLLTPVVAAAATSTLVSPRPMVYACARLANSASLLLPVSNLTNLLALPSLPDTSFLEFALLMAPVWLAVIAVEYVGHRLFFRPRPGRARPRRPAPAARAAARRTPRAGRR